MHKTTHGLQRRHGNIVSALQTSPTILDALYQKCAYSVKSWKNLEVQVEDQKILAILFIITHTDVARDYVCLPQKYT